MEMDAAVMLGRMRQADASVAGSALVPLASPGAFRPRRAACSQPPTTTTSYARAPATGAPQAPLEPLPLASHSGTDPQVGTHKGHVPRRPSMELHAVEAENSHFQCALKPQIFR